MNLTPGVLKNQWAKQKNGLSTPLKSDPTFSRQGLVLYADLWHPDQQAVGNFINGTGVATEAPATLSIGNNTINVTTQGTFIVYVRGSGSATSGTATVTGSPKALVSGHNTITVTGTGTITIALNNVIVSKDTNAYLMTIVGATWGTQGRDFDGLDDKITPPSLVTSGDWSFMMWIKSDAQDKTGNVILATAGGLDFFYGGTYANYANKFGVEAAGYSYANTAAVLNTWVMVGCAVRASDGYHFFYQNGLADGSVDDIPHYPSSPVIGSRGDDYWFNGKIGEVLIYSRLLLPLAFQHNYLGTKWRYQ